MENTMNTNDLKDKLGETADKARNFAASAVDNATEAGRTVTAEVKAHASETLETVKEAAAEKAGVARDTLVDAADRLADQLESEANEVNGMSARVLNGLASGVTTVSDRLRGRNLGDLLADAQDYARRNPATFAVGAAVAGFALARFIGSTAARQTAAARAAEATDRLYRDAARRTVDSQGRPDAQKANRG
jgi:hypothetical protein